MNMLRTPPSSVGSSKRKLEEEFSEQDNKTDSGDTTNKKLNLSERSDSDSNNSTNLRFGRQSKILKL